MTPTKKGESYEMILESRHLLGVFFAVVLLCALFFSLGFVLGRSQQSATQAAAQPPAQQTGANEPAPAREDLSFYDRVGGTPVTPPPPSRKPASAKPAPPPPAPAAKTTAVPASAQQIYLQVAALSQEADARRLAKELLNSGFPAVIRPPGDDRLHRVQVGPFASKELADAARQRLEARGFRQIVTR